MINYRFRFHSRGGVNFVRAHGKRLRERDFGLTFMPTTRKTSRIAVVVSKKTAKTAVARTRIRRKVYEIIRTEVLGGFSGSWDAILTVFNAGLAEMPHEELKRKVKALLKTLMT